MLVLILAVAAFALAAFLISRGCFAVSAGVALAVSIACSSAAAAELSFAAMRPQPAAVATGPMLDFSAMRSTPETFTAAAPAPLSFASMAHRQPQPPVKPPPVATSAAQALPQLLPAASYCVGPGCGQQVQPQPQPKRARGLFGRRR